jgi:hypothetical protein
LTPARVLALAVVLAAASLGVGYAASLGVTSQKLGSTTKAVSHGTCTLTPSQDSYVDQSAPQRNTNFGTATTLNVGARSNFQQIAFVQFALGGCSFPSGFAVDDATLTLTISTPPPNTRTFRLNRVGGTWAETTLTWNNQPAAGAQTGTASVTPSSTSTSYAVTTDVIAFLTGTANNGWEIADANLQTGPIASTTYSSRETAAKPRLVIDYSF